MTDRIKGFVVTLDKDLRDDDVEIIKTALSMVKGVTNVTAAVTNHDDIMNRERVKSELREKFWTFYKENLLPG